MHEHISPNQHNPIQKFHKNLKNPKNFQKPKTLVIKMHEFLKMKGLRIITKRFRLDLGRNLSG